MNEPTFSVIIPAHNSAKYITRLLDSIKSQSFKDYELIVVCDSCTDDTEQIAKQYTDKVYSFSFGQDGQTRNVGLEQATGKWILFADDDDWFLHEFVFRMLSEVITKHKEVDVVFFDFIWKNVGYTAQTKDNTYIACWNKCYRRDFISDCRFSNEIHSSDVQFYAQVMCKEPMGIFWNTPMYYYNFLREGSQSKELKDSGKMYQGVDIKEGD